MARQRTPGQKAADTRKKNEIQKKKTRTERLARTFTTYTLRRKGYRSIFLVSKKGFESTGIVDLVAAKKSGDKTELVLFQVKGNGKVSTAEMKRLRAVAKRIKVRYGISEYWKGSWPKPEIFDV